MANPVQVFNDSDLGVATAIAMHTLGALGFLAGLAAYFSWQRGLRRGQDNASLLRGAVFSTYLSIAVNLLGGFMRTYESDHPHLTSFAQSPWVQAILVKHLFLFTGMGAAVVLFERVAPRLRRDAAAGALERPKAGPRVAFSLAILGIGMAAILGSVSQVVAEFPAVDVPMATPHGEVSYQNFTGTFSGNPAMPAHAGGAFIVPANASTLAVRLDAGTASEPRWTLTGPDGAVHTFAAPTGQGTGQPLVEVLEHPVPGAWSFEVDSLLANSASWSVSAKSTVPAGEHGH